MDLKVTDLGVGRGGLMLLEDVDFTLRAGQALILRGPNGSGKTTLLRSLVGLLPPLAGSVSAPPEAFAFAAHADGLKSTLTVAENLSFWAAVHGTEDIGSALAAFDLGGLRDRPAQTLSAGQKRRLGLARLVVAGRPVWALDEPTVSLDDASVAQFAATMRAHLAGGGSAIIATHIDLGLEAEMLDISRFRTTAPGAGVFDEAFA